MTEEERDKYIKATFALAHGNASSILALLVKEFGTGSTEVKDLFSRITNATAIIVGAEKVAEELRKGLANPDDQKVFDLVQSGVSYKDAVKMVKGGTH